LKDADRANGPVYESRTGRVFMLNDVYAGESQGCDPDHLGCDVGGLEKGEVRRVVEAGIILGPSPSSAGAEGDVRRCLEVSRGRGV